MREVDIMAQCVKPPLGMPPCPIGMPAGVMAAPILIQLPAEAFQEGAGDSSLA